MYHKKNINNLLILVFVICSQLFSAERKASRAEIEHNFDLMQKDLELEIDILKMRIDDESKIKLQQRVSFLDRLKKDKASFVSYLQVVEKE